MNPDSHSFYLVHQIIATLILAIICMSVGLFIGWIFWGHCKNKVLEIKARNRQLRSELQDLDK